MVSSTMFLCKWPREPFAVNKIPNDKRVQAAIAMILRYENPALAVPPELPIEYHQELAETTLYMMHSISLGVHEIKGDTTQNVHLKNLRYWAYAQAGQDAQDVLASWCSSAGTQVILQSPEHAIVLVQALRAVHLMSYPNSEDTMMYLQSIHQFCITYLENMADDPTGPAADEAHREVSDEIWHEAAWEEFIYFLGRTLPVGNCTD